MVVFNTADIDIAHCRIEILLNPLVLIQALPALGIGKKNIGTIGGVVPIGDPLAFGLLIEAGKLYRIAIKRGIAITNIGTHQGIVFVTLGIAIGYDCAHLGT